MTNWISGYMETALQVAKVVGDVFGMALFAILLGFGRTLYAKFGRNISNVLLAGMMGAVVCYLTAGLCNTPIVALIACVLTGFCTSMLWPGTLILMEEKMPNPGIVAYALMAAGGDFGASIAPQAMGIVVDTVSVSAWAQKLSLSLGITTEQIGMKTGMLLSAIFPMIGVVLLLFIKRYFRKENV
jgi:MFS family permease